MNSLRRKTLLPLLLAILLLVVLVASGCEKTAVTEENETQKTETTETVKTTEEKATAEEPVSEEPYVLRSVKKANSAKIPENEGLSETYTRWEKGIEEELGIKIEYDWVASDDYETKVNLMLASGDMVDFFEATTTQFAELAANGVLEDLQAVYDEYANEITKGVVDETPGAFEYATINGELLAIPWLGLPQEQAAMIWTRTDWMDALGIDTPTTIDDIIDMATRFAKEDPDGNGKDDTIGLLLVDNLENARFTGFANAYGAYPNIWIDDGSGNLIYGSIQPEMKTVLAKAAELYANGVIAADFAATDNTAANSKISGGFNGLYFGKFHERTPPQDTVVNFGGDWISYPILGEEGADVKVQGDATIYSMFVIRKGYEHPEAIIKLMNFFIEKFYYTKTLEDYEYYVNDPTYGAQWVNTPMKYYRTYKNNELWEVINGVLDGSIDESTINTEQEARLAMVRDFLDNGNLQQWGMNMLFGTGNANGAGSMSHISYYRDNDMFIMNAYKGLPTATMTEKMSLLKDLQAETFTKIIMGELSIDEFDNFVTQWNELGGAQITQEVNASN